MREIETISDRIGRLEFDQPALKASIGQMGRPVDESTFVDKMRKALVRHANSYRNDLLTPREVYSSKAEIERQPDSPTKTALLLLKQVAEDNRTDLALTRRAFELLGQVKAIRDVERTVASILIMQDLGK